MHISLRIKNKTISLIFLNIFIISSVIGVTSYVNSTNTPIIDNSSSGTDPTQKVDPSIISDINSKGGLAQIGDSEYSNVIVVLYDNFNINNFKAPKFLDITELYPLINGFYAKIQLNKVFILADYAQVKSIWFDHEENSTTSAQETQNYLNFLSSSSSNTSDNNEFMNFTKEIGATNLWQKGINGSKVVIAVMDTGVDLTGQIKGDLDVFNDSFNASDPSTIEPKVVGAVSMVPEEPLYYTDFNGRGTYSAGIACGTGAMNSSYIGVAPGANFLNVKIYDSLGITYWSFMISGIEWAIEHSADVLLFCGSIPGVYLDPVSIAITAAVKEGVVVVVPTGDDGPSYMSVTTPGQALGAISVGAYNMHTQTVANFSGCGPGLDFRTTPDIVAPGVDLIGPRAQIITNDSLQVLSELTGVLGGIGGSSLSSLSSFSLPNGLFPKPTYGTPVDANYTMSSGTGAAASVVAGAIALLIQAFPLANPQLIRTAICDTARSITGNLNQEGCGEINVTAAYNYLYNIFGEQQYSKIPYSAPLIYDGFISTSDSANWTTTNKNTASTNAYDLTTLFSTQALMSAVIITNGTSNSSLGFTQVHLALNQFGLQFDGSNHWFSQFKVAREFSQISKTNIGAEGYNRYVGILELNGLYVTVIVESWNYLANYTTVDGQQIVTKYLNRINGFKISLDILNLQDNHENLTNLSLISYFKADMFLNKTGALSLNNTGGYMSILNAGLDDNISFNPVTQTMSDADYNNNTNYEYADKYAEMGFNSTTNQLTGYKIADSIGMLTNLTLYGANDSYMDNSTNYIKGKQDPGFAMMWDLTKSLNYGDNINFSSIFSIGIGTNATEAHKSLYNQMEDINSKVSFYPIRDLAVVKANFTRMSPVNEYYNSTAIVFNVGNVPINNSYLVFAANRTTESGSIEVYSRIKQIDYLGVNDYYTISQHWMPLDEGIYLVGWVIVVANIEENGTIVTEDNLLNNILARSVYIYSTQFYENILLKTFWAYPNKLDQEPMEIHYPGDIGLYNITTMNIIDIPDVTVSLDGPGKNYMMMMWQGPDIFSGILSNFSISDLGDLGSGLGGGTSSSDGSGTGIGGESGGGIPLNTSSFKFSSTLYTKTLHPYDTIFIVAYGPLLCPEGIVNFNITFSSPKYGGIFYRIPVQFNFSEYQGRVYFDGIHNSLFMNTNMSSFNLDSLNTSSLASFIDYSARLNYPYANYNNLRELWATPTTEDPEGVAMQTFLPGITINTSQYMNGLSSMGGSNSNSNSSSSLGGMSMSMSMNMSFIKNMLGGFTFENTTLTTNYIDNELLQFFDVLIINEPKIPLSSDEIQTIVNWVDKGGSLFVWAENKTYNQIDSLNQLLSNFNLSVSQDSDGGGGQKIVTSFNNPGDIFPQYNVGSIVFQDPVNVSIVPGTNGGASKVENLCNYIGVAERGKGRVCVVGDKDVFTNLGLMKGNNSEFAKKLIDFGLSVRFNLNITAQNSTIDQWKMNFFDANITNYENVKPVVDNGVLFICAYIYQDSTIVNYSLYGFQLPLIVMFEKQPGLYASYYDSSWYNKTGRYYAVFLIDSPEAAQEMLYVPFTVVAASPPPPVLQYVFPGPGYPHWIDVLGILWILMMGLLLWAYNTEKWKTRLNIVQLKGNVLNQAKTKVNEGESLLKQIVKGLDITEDEQEQIRLVLSYRKRLNKYIKDLKKFGEDIGEHYE